MATISKCVLWPSKWIDFLTVWPITLSYTMSYESLSKKQNVMLNQFNANGLIPEICK